MKLQQANTLYKGVIALKSLEDGQVGGTRQKSGLGIKGTDRFNFVWFFCGFICPL